MQDAKWFAKAMVDDGIFESYGRGGIMFTSAEGGGGEETRIGRYADGQNNIDGLLAMVNGGNKLAGHEFVEQFAYCNNVLN